MWIVKLSLQSFLNWKLLVVFVLKEVFMDIEINKIGTLIRKSRVRRGMIQEELVQN